MIDHLPVLSQDTLIVEHKQNPAFSPLQEAARTYKEIKNMAGGFHFSDDMLMKKQRHPDGPATDV